jgi:hypothetical protein
MKARDGTEWLKSRQTHYGLDKLGTIIPKSFDDKEVYDMPYFQRKEVRTETGKMEKRVAGVSFTKIYEKPFNAENLNELFSMAKGSSEQAKESAVSLSIVKLGESGEPEGPSFKVLKYSDFRGREFDELYDYVNT